VELGKLDILKVDLRTRLPGDAEFKASVVRNHINSIVNRELVVLLWAEVEQAVVRMLLLAELAGVLSLLADVVQDF